MSLVCPSCQHPGLPPASRFCLACGAELPRSEGPAPQDAYTPPHLVREVLGLRSTQVGERKDVTVVLADVAGSLALAQAIDPEDMHEVMDGLFAIVLEAVHAEGGTVNQFRGDGYMALFGAPRARGEDVPRALRAALRVRERLPALARTVRERFGLPFTLRTGVSTGTAWVGAIGRDLRRDYTAEGPSVGLAARLEQAAEPGQILLDEETARRGEALFRLRSLGPRSLRGVEGPVRVFELLGPGPHQARLDAERRRGLTPFVGRAEELWALDRAWSRASLGRLTLVEIRGEAGIGKSRLVLEHQLRTGGPCLPLRCRESDAQRALLPWLPLLRAWPEALGGGDEARRIARLLAGEEDASTDAPATGSLVDAIVDLLRQAARRGPLRLGVEDADWMDPSTRLVHERLLERAAEQPILLLLTARGGCRLEAAGALAEEIVLGPLERSAGAKIARAILGDGEESESLAAFAAERASGNPLFVEEVARALREAPEAVRSTARLESLVQGSRHRVPSTLQGVIAARIDALPDAGKGLLEAVASALGPVSRGVLAEIEPMPEPEIEACLADLSERGLLVEREAGLWEPQHALLRDVAYAQVLRQRRRELHRRCASALEKDALGTGGAGHSRVGTHYDLAGDEARAAHHLGRAGQAYLALNAPREAVSHLRRAWEIHGAGQGLDPSERAAVGLALASALNALDRSAEAGAVLAAIEPEDVGAQDRLRLGRVCVQSGWVAFSSQRDVARGRALLERGIALLGDAAAARQDTGTAHAYLSRILHLDGEIEGSIEHARRVAELAAAAGNRFGIAIGRAYEGLALCDRGEVAQAVDACEEASELANALESDVLAAMTRSALARSLAYAGAARRAIEIAQHAIALARRASQRGAEHFARVALGLAHLLEGSPAKAAAAFDQLGSGEEAWDSALDFRARGRLEQGRLDEAAELARRCLEGRPPRLVRVRALRTLGLALGLGAGAGAREGEHRIAESISLCEALGLWPHLAEGHAALAELCARRGERERADYFQQRASAGFARCGMAVHAGRLERAGG